MPALPRRPARTPRRRPHDSHGCATVTRRHSRPRDGEGTAWLVADRARGDFICYWYVGRTDDHLEQQARAATAEDAVAWGRARSARVRIRTAGGCSQGAGVAPRPEGMSHTWTTPMAALDEDAHGLFTRESTPC